MENLITESWLLPKHEQMCAMTILVCFKMFKPAFKQVIKFYGLWDKKLVLKEHFKKRIKDLI